MGALIPKAKILSPCIIISASEFIRAMTAKVLYLFNSVTYHKYSCTVFKNSGFEARLPEFKSWLYLFIPMRPQASYLTSSHLRFLIWKIRITVAASECRAVVKLKEMISMKHIKWCFGTQCVCKNCFLYI